MQNITQAEINDVVAALVAAPRTWKRVGTDRVTEVKVGQTTFRVSFDGAHLPLVDFRETNGNVETAHGSLDMGQYRALHAQITG